MGGDLWLAKDVGFNDDYASKGHEFFDVWAPEIATHYGEVFWTDQGNQPLPPEIVRRFEGKVMAITGYEMDQVMVNPVGHPGVNPKEDVSVPINWAYNHHYMAYMTGVHSELKRVPAAPGDPMAHGATTKWIAIDRPSAASRRDTSIPTSQFFSEGNGGESRKSFHGYPEGYAQLIESPNMWHITPMQIDTRNRDCGVTPADITNCTKFLPGPEPKQARYGLGIPPDTNYSGLLECPCNSRYGGDPIFYPLANSKIIEHKYQLGSGACKSGQAVTEPSSCFIGAQTLGLNASHFINQTLSDPKLPKGCSITRLENNTVVVRFNLNGQGNCSSSSKRSGEGTSPVGVKVEIELDSSGMFRMSSAGQYCSENRASKIKAFPMHSSTLEAATEARDQCQQFCWGSSTCWGCSVDCGSFSTWDCVFLLQPPQPQNKQTIPANVTLWRLASMTIKSFPYPGFLFRTDFFGLMNPNWNGRWEGALRLRSSLCRLPVECNQNVWQSRSVDRLHRRRHQLRSSNHFLMLVCVRICKRAKRQKGDVCIPWLQIYVLEILNTLEFENVDSLKT